MRPRALYRANVAGDACVMDLKLSVSALMLTTRLVVSLAPLGNVAEISTKARAFAAGSLA